MGFLRTYLDKHRLDPVSDKVKKNLDKIEQSIENRVSTGGTFEDCIKLHSAQVGDLVNRLSANLKTASISLSTIRFIINIAVEVYQLVDEIADCVIDDSLNEAEKAVERVEFGKDLTYFIWMTADPLRDRFNWLPFKKTIERKLVRWIAGMGLDAAFDLITANATAKTMSVGDKPSVAFKGLP